MNNGWLLVLDPPPREPALPDLDEGEAVCIRLALAHDGPSLLLMDELAGTAAVIGMARKHGLIASARDVFARLHATDFRISAEFISTVLQRVGESGPANGH